MNSSFPEFLFMRGQKNSVIQALLSAADLKQKQHTHESICLLNGCYLNL